MKQHLDTIISICALVGMIWRIAELKSKIYSAIEDLRDETEKTTTRIEHKLDIHLTEYGEKKMFTEYLIHNLDAKIEHKFKRLANWVRQISGFLNKQSDFQIRDDEY